MLATMRFHLCPMVPYSSKNADRTCEVYHVVADGERDRHRINVEVPLAWRHRTAWQAMPADERRAIVLDFARRNVFLAERHERIEPLVLRMDTLPMAGV